MRWVLVFLSLVPHLYVAAVGAQQGGFDWFLIGALLANVLPVGIGAMLLQTRWAGVGVGWLIATLLASGYAVWVGLVRPQGSTSALIFLVLPVWNCLLVGPVGALVALGWRQLWRSP
jgi:hypothetical protein